MTDTVSPVAAHYARGDLATRILDSMAAAGKDVDALTADDLAPVDEFHIRGRQATAELAELARIAAADRVLDVGCGIGGPSRFLAATRGCRVTGVDLTAEYCDVAAMLAERTGLAERVAYRQGDALALPYDAASFDVVWTQHAQMNIADKPRLYGEMFRVLKPGGRLAFYDILAGPEGPIHFPVPWARTPEISDLVTPEALRALLQGIGFGIAEWRDATAPAVEWFHEARAKAAEAAKAGKEPLTSLRILAGEGWRELAANMVRNLEEGRIVLVQAVAGKG